jgi:hypothetical protein
VYAFRHVFWMSSLENDDEAVPALFELSIPSWIHYKSDIQMCKVEIISSLLFSILLCEFHRKNLFNDFRFFPLTAHHDRPQQLNLTSFQQVLPPNNENPRQIFSQSSKCKEEVPNHCFHHVLLYSLEYDSTKLCMLGLQQLNHVR